MSERMEGGTGWKEVGVVLGERAYNGGGSHKGRRGSIEGPIDNSQELMPAKAKKLIQINPKSVWSRFDKPRASLSGLVAPEH